MRTASIGLIAHVDTSPDAPGAHVEPIVHRAYDGSAIALPRGGTVLDPAQMPLLAAAAGHDIVTSSGDTLLGADDKAGVAEIMAAVAHLAAHPELPRPTIRICFTPDEEIGEGASLFDVERFGAICAYTLDGSELGELQDETFAAAAVTLTIHGVDTHPGWAIGTLVNAARLAGELLAALPPELTPERTEGRDGFIHPYQVEASNGVAVVRAIVRDFDDGKLAAHVALLRRTAEEVVATAPAARLEVEVRPQYPNMRRFVDAFPAVVTAAERALRLEGIEPVRTPIRGGTDGSLPERAGAADPQPVHRRPRLPLDTRVGVAARRWPRRRRPSCGWLRCGRSRSCGLSTSPEPEARGAAMLAALTAAFIVPLRVPR